MLGNVIIHLGDSAGFAGVCGLRVEGYGLGNGDNMPARLAAELARVTRGLRVSGLRVGEGGHHSRSWWHAVFMVSPEMEGGRP